MVCFYLLVSLFYEDLWLEFYIDCSVFGVFCDCVWCLVFGVFLCLGELCGGVLCYELDW